TLPYWFTQRGLSDAYIALSLSIYSFSATMGTFLWGMATLRSLVFMSFSTTLPYWFTQRGLSDAYIALSLSIYSFSATMGTFL
ncbi:hypothetical protein, partial [Streptococcus pneumoniae]|uniref:hypothetical protein n=1 Tax=Streptococcus pneumoniae TaxID=1313 RepID=UPI001CB76935